MEDRFLEICKEYTGMIIEKGVKEEWEDVKTFDFGDEREGASENVTKFVQYEFDESDLFLIDGLDLDEKGIVFRRLDSTEREECLVEWIDRYWDKDEVKNRFGWIRGEKSETEIQCNIFQDDEKGCIVLEGERTFVKR